MLIVIHGSDIVFTPRSARYAGGRRERIQQHISDDEANQKYSLGAFDDDDDDISRCGNRNNIEMSMIENRGAQMWHSIL